MPFYPHTSYKLLPDTSHLLVDKKTILSREGCTQGDPLAMLMYGIAIKPPILKLQTPRTVQKWYADNGNAAWTLQQLHELFENLSNQGPSFGYHVNVPKLQLIVKPSTKQKAKIFLRKSMSKFSMVREFSDQLLAVTSICRVFERQTQRPNKINSKTLKVCQVITPRSLPLLRPRTLDENDFYVQNHT